jgi:hypothetical protein
MYIFSDAVEMQKNEKFSLSRLGYFSVKSSDFHNFAFVSFWNKMNARNFVSTTCFGSYQGGKVLTTRLNELFRSQRKCN